MVFAAIRVRGTLDIKPDIRKTLQGLRLNRVNHCALIDDNSSSKGMLQMVKDYTTWGEISQETLIKLISSRGMLMGDKLLSVEYLHSATSFKTIDALAKAIVEGQFLYRDIPDVKPIFR